MWGLSIQGNFAFQITFSLKLGRHFAPEVQEIKTEKVASFFRPAAASIWDESLFRLSCAKYLSLSEVLSKPLLHAMWF